MADNEPALKLDTGNNVPTLPPIAAAFLVVFDHRKGYVLAWQNAIEGLELEGTVELKSLPSGLHNVDEDLVYLVHDDYVGVSAYINKPDASSARKANMLAVGVLVPLQHGRMGKSWLHAPGIQALARKLIENISDTSPLEAYWSEHQLQPSRLPAAPDESTESLSFPKNNANGGYQKFRSMSTASTFTPGIHTLSPHHPAATLMESLDIFGPLIFPLYRFALLRKRILIITDAPVEFACNIVYNLSILSSIPRSLLQLLPSTISPDLLRRKALFTVGIADIPLLSQSSPTGWIACTTDDVLATKPECFDILVLLPSADARRARQRSYPTIVCSSPDLSKRFPRQGLKATQRDAERYTILREGLRAFPASIVEQPVQEASDDTTAIEDDGASTLSAASTVQERKEIVEPASWSQIAYTSLLWWASAGERQVGITETEEMQRELDLSLLGEGDEEGDERTKEVVLVGWFRRLTGVMLDAVSNIAGAEERYEDDEVEEAEEVAEDGDERGAQDERSLLRQQSEHNDDPVEFSSEDISSMALDMWSASDWQFVEDFVQIWWGRKAKVRGMGVECCGVKVL